MRMLQALVGVWLAYLATELALYWLPLLSALRKPNAPATASPPKADSQPVIAVASACRDGAVCIPGLAKSFAEQIYPATHCRLFLAADNCTDDSAALARASGMQVFERHDPRTAGKGNAISELLQQRLQNEAFDILLVLDIDARVSPTFLERLARALPDGKPLIVSCATVAKNANDTLYTQVGAIIQGLLRLHQDGRAALGWDAALYGSHGYALSRAALERLAWRTTTGQIAEDMELRLRATLAGIPIRYVPDLRVLNDVTADAAAVREQRRRWNATYLPLIPRYLGPLLRRALRGDSRALESLFGLLLLPSFANLFLFLLLTSAALLWAAHRHLAWHGLAGGSSVLFSVDLLYFMVAFRRLGVHLGLRELRGLLAHLSLRALALVESLFFIHVKNWAPAPHKEDR